MKPTRKETVVGRAFAGGAALAFATSNVLIRKGLGTLASPLVGATIAMLSGTLILTIMVARNLEKNLRQKKKGVGFLLLTGVFYGLGMAATYLSLNLAPVVMVAPIISSSPLFTLLLAYLFLGRLERITPRLILGTVPIVAGATLATMGNAG